MRHEDNATIIPLRRDFRFIHEPVHYSKRGTLARFVGREQELAELTHRIFYTDGGSFLVTGYRGVGKTSFVNHTIKHVEQLTHTFESTLGPTRVLHIHLNLARPLTPAELMYHLIRSLYQELEQQRLLKRLDRRTRDALALAVQRTSMSIARSSERSGEIGYDLSKLVTGIQAINAMSGVFSGKVSRSQKLDLNYLAYDDKSAEYDLIQLAGQLIHSYRERRGLWRQRVRLKIIFVFDELDKLEGFTSANGTPVIDDILSTLKNLFTTSGLFFIFIAGRDLQERLTEDIGRGDSIYESVFTYAIYLPAMWTDIDAICNELLEPAPIKTGTSPTVTSSTGINPSGTDLDLFKQYLAYKGRGIPRRILRGFNQFVGMNNNLLVLLFRRQDLRRIRFYAQLQEAISLEDKRLGKYIYEEVRGERRDKRLLSIYYLIDWILQQGNRLFTLAEVQTVAGHLSTKIAPDALVAEDVVRATVDMLVSRNYLEREDVSSRIQIGNQSQEQVARFRLARRRLLEMGDVGEDANEPSSPHDTPRSQFELDGYIISGIAGQGGFADIYRATRRSTMQQVAIKISSEAVTSGMAREYFMREIRLLREIEHSNIVPLIESGAISGRLYFVMPFIDGITASDLSKIQKRVGLDMTLAIMRPIIMAHSYLHQRGIVRTDAKPANIMIDRAGHVWMIDLGIAIDTNETNANIKGAGTARYAAPEQWKNEIVDARADIFSLGVTLYELIVGNSAFESTVPHSSQPMTLTSEHLAHVPRSIRRVIERCVQVDVNERFSSAEELLAALPHTREVNLSELVLLVQGYQQRVDSYERVETLEEVDSSAVEHSVPLLPQLVEPPDLDTASRAINGDAPTVPASAAQDEPQNSPVLRGLKVERATAIDEYGAYYQLEPEQPIHLGRSLDNDIVIADTRVSRYHAAIRWNGSEFTIEDLNSVTGTILNGESIGQSKFVPLADGDTIVIGDQTLIFWKQRTVPPPRKLAMA